MDAWIHLHQQLRHDEKGAWAAAGKIHAGLLERLLSDAYFKLAPPKSTGREQFNLKWLQQHLDLLAEKISPVDVQATLIELTARTIIAAIQNNFSQGEILICGGGAHNDFLMQRLQHLAAPHFSVSTTQTYGIDPDWVEAIAFAWLARQTLHHKPGNLPKVTGAKIATVLGGVYYL
jgi:anhydro-N-acetylmuramic acid kinase